MSATLLAGEGLAQRRIRVPRSDVAWVRYVLEAHEGLANLHGSGDGTLTLLVPISQRGALDALLEDLASEVPWVDDPGEGRK